MFTSPDQVVPGRKLTRHRGKACNLIKQHGDSFMQTRHQIALLTAGLLIGAQIGIASMDTPIADSSDQMEPIPSEALALEGGISGEPAEAQSEAAATPDENGQTPIAADEQPIMPLAARHTEPQSTAFPASADDLQMLPAMAEYLDRTAHLRVTGASGNVFPASADELPMLPALVAFLDGREATRLAAQMGQPVAGDATAADASLDESSETAVTTPTEQEPAREVSLLDRILPQRLRNLF
ncbi:MAG: hypothetical protein HY322_16320 [Betaproteobacteria bacterium]|nr:hypothetical protein [Betaproteobacteria bacterium]